MSGNSNESWSDWFVRILQYCVGHIPILGPMIGNWVRGQSATQTASSDPQPQAPQATASAELPAPSPTPNLRATVNARA